MLVVWYQWCSCEFEPGRGQNSTIHPKQAAAAATAAAATAVAAAEQLAAALAMEQLRAACSRRSSSLAAQCRRSSSSSRRAATTERQRAAAATTAADKGPHILYIVKLKIVVPIKGNAQKHKKKLNVNVWRDGTLRGYSGSGKYGAGNREWVLRSGQWAAGSG